MINEIKITKVSIDYFTIYRRCLMRYGGHLFKLVEAQRNNHNLFSTTHKDYSICLEMALALNSILLKAIVFSELDKKKRNKSWKIPIYSAIVILDAIQYYEPFKGPHESPAIEHFKNQATKQMF